MALDGHIDDREIAIIKPMCENSPLFLNFNFQEEINSLVNKINNGGKEFIQHYFNLLSSSKLSEQEELTLIDFAIKTIKADDQVEYSEIKFFKNIRHRLKVTDDVILNSFPDFEFFLEEDIITNTILDKITKQYFEATELPQFELINIITNSSSDSKKDDNHH